MAQRSDIQIKSFMTAIIKNECCLIHKKPKN